MSKSVHAVVVAIGLLFAAARNVSAQVPAFDHVFIVIMENHEFDDIVGNPEAPFINSLIDTYGLATNYSGVVHPSLPNYMALTGGQTVFTDNCTYCQTDAPNIADRIEASGRTWSGYMEDMPAPCGFDDSGLYVARHNPFLHYTNIATNSARCSRTVPFSRFSSDLQNGRLANYVWITPNLCNDMHDCATGVGDSWLSSLVPQITNSAAFANSVLFLVWDEGTSDLGGGGRIPMVVVSPMTPAGTRSAVSANHYDLLRTIEDAWSLPPLGNSANATAMTAFFPPPGGSLPAPWTSQDVGSTGRQGSASFSSGVFTVRGAGSDIWGAADSFQFVSQAVSGDLQIVTRVTSVENTNTFAKAGLMLRSSLSAGSAHVVLDVRPNGSVEFMTRSASGAATSYIAGAAAGIPVWLRLTRSGSTVTGSVSSDGTTWTTVGNTSVAFTSANAGLVVTSHDTAALNTASFNNVSIGAGVVPPPPQPPPPSSSLPTPWTSQDVGSTGMAGSASFSNGVFTVAGAGSDIWGTADAFEYVSQPIDGDSQITARVTAVQNTDPYAKAGVMLRVTLSPGSRHVILDVRPDGTVEFMTRSTSGDTTSYLGGVVQSFPVWVRLVRSGSIVTGLVSSNGASWTSVGSVGISFGSAAIAGLAVTSHNTSVVNTSSFDNVMVAAASTTPTSSLPAAWTSQDVGSTGQAGSASFANSVFTVRGAGSDIWGTSDSFQYVLQQVAGDVQIIARVTAVQNTDTYAKAGVMIRASVAAGAADVILDVRPNGSIEFMTRSSAGGATAYVAGAVQSTPAWLKLARVGTTITGSVSGNGTTWTMVGSTTTTIGSAATAGLAVTSHNSGALNTSTFDNVSVQ